MSPKPSRVTPFPIEASGVAEDLVFGEEGRPSLVIPKALIAQIWAQVTEGTRMLSRGGGLEVGGLLVGPKVRGGKVAIDEIIPVAIEYEHGPSFQMSATDLERVGPAVEAVQDDPSKVVVGVYRSRTRGDGTLRESDLEIFDAIQHAHTSYDADFRTCLVLAPVAESTALACIAVRYGGGWHEMQPFTLRSNPLAIIAMPPSNALLPIVRNHNSEEPTTPVVVSNSAMQPITEHRAPERRITEHRMAERRPPEPRIAEPPPLESDEAEPHLGEMRRGRGPAASSVWLVRRRRPGIDLRALRLSRFQKPACSFRHSRGDSHQHASGIFGDARRSGVEALLGSRRNGRAEPRRSGAFD